ncbi:hypothetical protein AMQ84_15545 [Paenibacillus riograndensis]|uniref:Uncharacterized protein n=1 Tax=Paenibacillus riograndensis TaxID=483937 RepID=A0A132TYM6_9BACL|nr:hypothetical protein AMQ84_15545 [Paenibacillus riograndensis]
MNRYTSVFCVQIARFMGGNTSWDGLNSAFLQAYTFMEAPARNRNGCTVRNGQYSRFFLGWPGDPASLLPEGPLLSLSFGTPP